MTTQVNLHSPIIYYLTYLTLSVTLCSGQQNQNHSIHHIRSCVTTIKQPGVYHVNGSNIRRTSTSSKCQLFIIAPPLRNVKLTFPTVKVNCENSGIVIQDGLTTLPNNKGGRDFLPQRVAPDQRKRFLCTNNAENLESVSMSQNFGHLLYKLQNEEYFTIEVEFTPSDNICDALMIAEGNPHSYVLQADGAGSCRVYISGSGRLRVSEFHSKPRQIDDCDNENGSSLSLQVNSTSWKALPLRNRMLNCKYSFTDVIIPCQYNILELRNSGSGRMSARFTLEELSDRYKDPWSALCY